MQSVLLVHLCDLTLARFLVQGQDVAMFCKETWYGPAVPQQDMNTEVIYAVGAVTVSILGALRFSRCTRIKCGCIEIERDAQQEAQTDNRDGQQALSDSRPPARADEKP